MGPTWLDCHSSFVLSSEKPATVSPQYQHPWHHQHQQQQQQLPAFVDGSEELPFPPVSGSSKKVNQIKQLVVRDVVVVVDIGAVVFVDVDVVAVVVWRRDTRQEQRNVFEDVISSFLLSFKQTQRSSFLKFNFEFASGKKRFVFLGLRFWSFALMTMMT